MSATSSLGDSEKYMLEELAKTKLMRRKLKYDTVRHKKTKHMLHDTEHEHKEHKDKEHKDKENKDKLKKDPIKSNTWSPDRDLFRKVKELEKMQELYKQRIFELEKQVSSFTDFHDGAAAALQKRCDSPSRIAKRTAPTSALPTPHTKASLFEGHRRSTKAGHESVTIPNSQSAFEDKMDIPVASIQSKFLPQFLQFPRVKKTASVDVVVKPKLLALYDYKTDKPGRLSFSEGQVLFLVKRSRSGWWTAELAGKTGKIPSNYVETLDASKAFRARVVKEFDGQQTGDLAIKRGELVTILKKQDNGWWLGERGGQTGFFPSKNIEKVQANAVAEA
eukprot:TRINITY_DN7237_c0_g1_i1.p1 TRINITY_DN7237_c0_g1~~TRINITY_DN7237_c0_g1_i1.p1  ORF type:complete len:334 (+),score=95.64 TRINITY_DN7237_c0_g1_i1:146-1147(+)